MMLKIFAALVLSSAFRALAAAPDTTALGDYRPRHRVSGVIRSRGSNQMAALMKRWEAGFRKYHPQVYFADTLKGSASGIYGLEMRTADIALMGRPINPFERYGTYERAWVYPVEIEVATGSFSVPPQVACVRGLRAQGQSAFQAHVEAARRHFWRPTRGRLESADLG